MKSVKDVWRKLFYKFYVPDGVGSFDTRKKQWRKDPSKMNDDFEEFVMKKVNLDSLHPPKRATTPPRKSKRQQLTTKRNNATNKRGEKQKRKKRRK